MEPLKRGRPPTVMVLAALALVFAVVGTAVAGPETVSRALTKSKVKSISKKQATKVFDSRIADATVANANALGGVAAADYAKKADVRADGAAATNYLDDFTSATFTPVVSKAITAPSDGFLFIVASLSAEDDNSFGGENQLLYRLRLDATPLTNEAFYHEISSGPANDDGGNSGATSAVVAVTAGAHTVHLEAREVGTGSFIIGRDLSILFVPNGSGITVPITRAQGNSNQAPQGSPSP